MFYDGFRRVMLLCCFLLGHIQAPEYSGETQDQTSARANTLIDDADDIQRQLDSEARDRVKYGRPKTVWVFHFPTHFSGSDSMENSTELSRSYRDLNFTKLQETIRSYLKAINYRTTTTTALPQSRDWDYKSQHIWSKMFTECGGPSQSPIDLPVDGLVRAMSSKTRRLRFINYDMMPTSLSLSNDGKRVVLSGVWPADHRPIVYGGAAYSRRYVFHSLTIHWPSEHAVGGLLYPIESQAIHVSAEYNSFDDALHASPSDPLAFLGIANIYKYSPKTQRGLSKILTRAIKMGVNNITIEGKPLKYFNPPFKKYVCYQGSLTVPPCTESVLWFVRSRAMSVSRDLAEAANCIFSSEVPRKNFVRSLQPRNDRRIFLFN